MAYILAVNPGSTSTKLGLFHKEVCLFKETIRHPEHELAAFSTVMEQADYRRQVLLRMLQDKGVTVRSLSALVVRGGLLRPVEGGVWLVNDTMVDELVHCRFGAHASNLGAVLALPLGRELGIPVYTVDPVTVDEFADVARYSGLQGVPRLSMSHALNMKAVAHKAAEKLQKRYDELNLVVAHLGSGISVSAHHHGRMVDVNNANNEGPFSLERCGTLPALALIGLCFDGTRTSQEMKQLVTVRGGLYSYLGTKDFLEVERRIADGDEQARRVVTAMAYQVAKEIGGMAAVLAGKVHRVLLTGGLANSQLLTGLIYERVNFIAPVEIFPGEEELEALAMGALRVLQGKDRAKIYS